MWRFYYSRFSLKSFFVYTQANIWNYSIGIFTISDKNLKTPLNQLVILNPSCKMMLLYLNKSTLLIMIFKIPFFIAFLFLISCSSKKQFPDLVSEKVEIERVNLNAELPILTSYNTVISEIKGVNKLKTFQNHFLERSTEFNLDEFKSNWNKIRKENDFENASAEDVGKWYEVSGFLLELTGEAVFASELQKIILSGIGETIEGNKKIVTPYIFTKNYDNLFINVFTPATIDYEHTTKGKVKVVMETNYPQSGKVDLKFGMTERRYIEVNIRIPEWAEGTTVTVKKVKYFAPPGGYCKIAKKWKEGDLVEIIFPMENVPEYF